MLDVGCEVHFFGRDLKNFYIATKDASSISEKFTTYENIKINTSYLK